jgi:ubiquinone/menaquinone biosynthesis C-methylase UbiE
VVDPDAFTRTVREYSDESYSKGEHHPLGSYMRAAHRHYVRQRALLAALDPLTFRTALDVGCSEGFFLSTIAATFRAEVWGVDLSREAVLKMRKRYGYPGAAADGAKLPFADGSFDLVYSTETIEHVIDPSRFLDELRRVARKHILVTTPASKGSESFNPDYALTAEGHIQEFPRTRIESLFGRDAQIKSFRNNLTFGFYKLVVRHLGQRASSAIVGLDHRFSQRFGSASSRNWMLRNRDWLVIATGGGASAGSPSLACTECHSPLGERGDVLTCLGCGSSFPVRDGVPEFFHLDTVA